MTNVVTLTIDTPVVEVRRNKSPNRIVVGGGGASSTGFTTDLPELVKTDDYTQLQTDRGYVITFNKGTSVTYTLLAAATAGAGYHVMVKNIGAGTLTVDPDSSELINGAATLSVPTGAFARIWCTGTAWRASISFDTDNAAFTGGSVTFDALTMAGNLDLDGNDLIVDADGDSYIHEVSDDVIGVVVAGSQVANFNQYGFGAGIAPDATYTLKTKKDVSGNSGIYHENLDSAGNAIIRLAAQSGVYGQLSASYTGEVLFQSNGSNFNITNTAGNIRLQPSNLTRLYASTSTEVLRCSSTVATFYKPVLFTPVTVSGLPGAAIGVGTRAFVTDATATTFASVVAGGGANAVPVYSDGTNWRIG